MQIGILTPQSVKNYQNILPRLADIPLLEYFWEVGVSLITIDPAYNPLTEIAQEMFADDLPQDLNEMNLKLKQFHNFHNESIVFYDHLIMTDPETDPQEAEKIDATIAELARPLTPQEHREILQESVFDAIETVAEEYGFYDVMSEFETFGELFEYLETTELYQLPMFKETFELLIEVDITLQDKRPRGKRLLSLSVLFSVALANFNILRKARLDAQEKLRKVGSNDPCPCGSGKKYKKCCMNKATTATPPRPASQKKTQKEKAKSPRKIYQLRIDLMETKPPIWRRILIHSDASLSDLHCAIQAAMGWEDYHMHQFEKDRRFYGPPESDEEDGYFQVLDENDFTVGDLLHEEKDYLHYEYDFGDGWRHRVRLEKILEPDPSLRLPLCPKGRKACPPEDVGGVWGYYNLLEILEDPQHPEYRETLEWLGEAFDPDRFDLEEANARLREMCSKAP